MHFNEFVRDIVDFPKPGITFKDITPLLQDPKALQQAAEALYVLVNERPIDKVVGVDSRGFIFAPILAMKLNAGFVPVRKAGKLPFRTVAEPYQLEYGQDILEIHTDAILKGEKVLVHDDVLATGGTCKAVCKLVEQLGGEVVQCNFLVNLTFLKGAAQLPNYTITSLLSY
ncbi:Adenine phosphoribosyltransferase [Croceitalea dokdonensis DOKDO 023]|uniref:Adenine phosphoribosyltransferase n=1 Tax=Croceitalea dokdonensis DOKDO 023 TaxID=1300341 RepID=A0A0P7AS03_9FLAO|nr:adenine phosphoribosyltransferase [Croceitalea dokdonensis]KPM30699.1 Adenine phosphoribosyltransferase [Croceitalea dokdonensis DOKDO 023]